MTTNTAPTIDARDYMPAGTILCSQWGYEQTIDPHPFIELTDYERAYIWDGKPVGGSSWN